MSKIVSTADHGHRSLCRRLHKPFDEACEAARSAPRSSFGAERAAANPSLESGLSNGGDKMLDAINRYQRDSHSFHTCPGRNAGKRSGEMPAAFKASASAKSGASIGSSLSWNVP
jgi:hypothetical protein